MAAGVPKPFRFENLERISRREVDLRAAILRYLPAALPPEIFLDRITQQLEKYTNDRVHLELSALREPPFSKYLASIPDPAILFVISCPPLDRKAVLQVDFALAHILVDRMLGGPGEYPADLRPVTPIEEGVLQFLILKILKILGDAMEGSGILFRLDGLVSEPAKIAELSEPQDLLAILSIQLTVGKKAGFVRLALPHPLLEGLLKGLTPQDRAVSEKDVARLQAFTDIKLPIWIELGTVDIGTADLARLESGDVVLLDQVHVEIGEHGIQGPVTLRVKEGVGGGFQAHVIETGEQSIAVQIDGAF